KKGISDAERQALRHFYFQTKPQPRQKDVIAWFQAQYRRKLGQATISDLLHAHYKHLDIPAKASPAAYRQQMDRWPTLEKILFSWQQQIETTGSVVSGELLAEKARNIWLLLPEYNTKVLPEFSSGWLTRFKAR
ncbi:hypothetical protein EJ04DRAFT_393631, partial [Polyplosphaeria fusca]